MSSGKKGKKNKGKVLSLQSFLSNGEETPIGITQVAKKIRDSDDEGTLPQIYQLPTAPRSIRLFDDDSITHSPPYMAHISNLPFDAKEEDIYDFFEVPLLSVRLPREEGETGRIRGFGNIEFETREDLIYAISLPDPHIRNRRVRIGLPTENEYNKNRGHNRNNRYESGSGFSASGENRDSSNWRRGDNDNNRDDNRRGGNNYNRNYRSNQEDRGSEGGSWRTGRSGADMSPPRRSDRCDRNDRGDRNDRYNRNTEDTQAERPKLNLAPRTLPLPEIVTKPVVEVVRSLSPEPPKRTAEQIFGSAKPVDTAAKEKEIEDKLEKERTDQLKKIEVKQIEGKLADVNINKDDKDNKNNVNWRKRDDDNQNEGRSIQRRNGERRNDRDKRGNDFNHSNYDNRNSKDNRNVKHDDYKPKKEVTKHERPYQPKNNQQQSIAPATNVANKYSGLLDEDSDE